MKEIWFADSCEDDSSSLRLIVRAFDCLFTFQCSLFRMEFQVLNTFKASVLNNSVSFNNRAKTESRRIFMNTSTSQQQQKMI
ncbi:CLUMA_CG003516, isoform A [Clunio marinus]|uniref:CLUMA_CG003516, isoform A n=1 Tax=Clunio marinus TaxID=568069 RepID=A0A1J1HNZ8_9DIPT|nr:CLUMA_CG003516, isoform A [Clunio marinus]